MTRRGNSVPLAVVFDTDYERMKDWVSIYIDSNEPQKLASVMSKEMRNAAQRDMEDYLARLKVNPSAPLSKHHSYDCMIGQDARETLRHIVFPSHDVFIADLGASTGRFLSELVRSQRVVGRRSTNRFLAVEANPDHVALGRLMREVEGVSEVEFHQGDATKLSNVVADAAVDVVFMEKLMTDLHEKNERQKMIDLVCETDRILRQGGVLHAIDEGNTPIAVFELFSKAGYELTTRQKIPGVQTRDNYLLLSFKKVRLSMDPVGLRKMLEAVPITPFEFAYANTPSSVELWKFLDAGIPNPTLASADATRGRAAQPPPERLVKAAQEIMQRLGTYGISERMREGRLWSDPNAPVKERIFLLVNPREVYGRFFECLMASDVAAHVLKERNISFKRDSLVTLKETFGGKFASHFHDLIASESDGETWVLDPTRLFSNDVLFRASDVFNAAHWGSRSESETIKSVDHLQVEPIGDGGAILRRIRAKDPIPAVNLMIPSSGIKNALTTPAGKLKDLEMEVTIFVQPMEQYTVILTLSKMRYDKNDGKLRAVDIAGLKWGPFSQLEIEAIQKRFPHREKITREDAVRLAKELYRTRGSPNPIQRNALDDVLLDNSEVVTWIFTGLLFGDEIAFAEQLLLWQMERLHAQARSVGLESETGWLASFL